MLRAHVSYRHERPPRNSVPLQQDRVIPPSNTRLDPVVKLDLELQRKTAASAASSGLPRRRRGMVAKSASSNPGATSVARRVIGVSVQVGQTQFTRMPRGALSRAAPFVRNVRSSQVDSWVQLPAVFVIPVMACLHVVYCLV